MMIHDRSSCKQPGQPKRDKAAKTCFARAADHNGRTLIGGFTQRPAWNGV